MYLAFSPTCVKSPAGMVARSEVKAHAVTVVLYRVVLRGWSQPRMLSRTVLCRSQACCGTYDAAHCTHNLQKLPTHNQALS